MKTYVMASVYLWSAAVAFIAGVALVKVAGEHNGNVLLLVSGACMTGAVAFKSRLNRTPSAPFGLITLAATTGWLVAMHMVGGWILAGIILFGGLLPALILGLVIGALLRLSTS